MCLIREMTVSDAPQVARIHIKSWQDAYKGIVAQSYLDGLDVDERTRRWEGNIAKPLGTNFVAEKHGTVIGFSGVGKNRDKGMEEYAELYAIYIDPAFYNQGVGYRLFEKSVVKARELGYKKMSVWVLKENSRGRAFYKSMGGAHAPAADKEVIIGDDPHAEIQYRWSNLNE